MCARIGTRDLSCAESETSDQRTLASVPYDTKGRTTRRERFLTEMDAVIPWVRLQALILPHYAVAGRGRRPLPLATMLRVYFLQQWFDLSDPQAEEMLYDSESMRRFARVELGEDTVPDESTIMRFWHLLETHQLTARIFDAVRTLLTEQRLLLRAGTIIDATIIAAPSSTKNATKTRDPAMKQTRKGQQWYFRMKVHIGTDTGGSCTRSRPRMRRRRTSGNCRICSRARRRTCTATRPITSTTTRHTGRQRAGVTASTKVARGRRGRMHTMPHAHGSARELNTSFTS